MTFMGTADMLHNNVIIYIHEIFLPAIQPGVEEGLGRVFKILVCCVLFPVARVPTCVPHTDIVG